MEHPFLDDYQFKVPLVVDAKVGNIGNILEP